jgi:hypothetical protein
MSRQLKSPFGDPPRNVWIVGHLTQGGQCHHSDGVRFEIVSKFLFGD